MTDAPAPSYEASIAELEELLAAIEDDALPIDELAPRVERASALLTMCRDILVRTEARVSEAVDALRAPPGDEA